MPPRAVSPQFRITEILFFKSGPLPVTRGEVMCPQSPKLLASAVVVHGYNSK